MLVTGFAILVGIGTALLLMPWAREPGIPANLVVALFTSTDVGALRAEARDGAIHRAAEIDVWQLEQSFLDTFGQRIERTMQLEIVHTGGRLYLTVGGEVIEGSVERAPLLATA